MLMLGMWWLGILLEALLLVRGLQSKLITKFPIFYSYLLFVFTQELLRFGVYRWAQNFYSPVYWITQLIGLVMGSAVVFEIYRMGLKEFPGTAKLVRIGLGFVFGAIFLKVIIAPPGDPRGWLAGACVGLERDLRIVQALALIGLVSLFLWYAIPFGKNLKGILTGYSVFIAMSVIQLTLMASLWQSFQVAWNYLQPASYLFVLCIWAEALWSAEAVAKAKSGAKLEQDYDALVASTGQMLDRARARLGWAVRA
jgi:hypothetical protein